MSSAQPLWTPSSDRVATANLTSFIAQAQREWEVALPDYAALWRWSVDQPERFWETLWRFGGVRASQDWDQVLDDPDRMPGARWFGGARLNFTENLLRRSDDETAVVFWSETGVRRYLTWSELGRAVAEVAAALRADGVGPGDRVAGFLPNLPETVIAGLAAISLGATWSSCSPDFGAGAVVDRLGQIEPKVLFTADGYVYGGKRFETLPKVRQVLDKVPSLRRVVVVPWLDEGIALDGLGEPQWWDEYRASGAGAALACEQLPFDHPLFVLYSSGTTGKPKAIVHGVGGTLLQHLKEHLLHTDVKPGERLFYFTTCGWMMWNWLISGLASEATIVLYEGSPFHPRPEVLWDLAEQERLAVFGTAARYIAAIEKQGLKPRESHDLAPLRAILSTGSPLAPESFDYVYRDVKSDLCLSSISGGTDIVSCFALGNPTAPVWRSELQTRGLGMAVNVFDQQGQPVRGEKGELVCTRPFPSMPVSFWDDPDGERYRKAYFDHFPGVWRHGDFAELTDHDGMVIYGRSDAVLNPGGVRIGTSEIYCILEQLEAVADAVVVGQDHGDDQRVVLFVRLAEGHELDDGLRESIKTAIRRGASPRHVPALVIAVPDIPRTINNKIVELSVREVIHGREPRNRDALINPEALDYFRDLPELQG